MRVATKIVNEISEFLAFIFIKSKELTLFELRIR